MRLNLGCGSDDYQAGAEWVNADRYAESAHHHSPTKADLRADAEYLPFEDGSFEHVRFRHVMEHVERPLDVLRELHRIIEPRGEAYVEVPHPPSVKTEETKYHTMHLYSWTKGSLVRIVERAGFADVTYHGHHPESMAGGHAVIGRKD